MILPNVSAIFRGSMLSLGLVLLVICSANGRVAAQAPSIDSEEQFMLKLINDYRGQRGLSQLRISITLTRSAEWMSWDMSSRNYFGHIDSLGRESAARMAAFGYTYNSYRGENLAAGYSDAARTFNQWVNSPTHNETMLNPNYNVIGISRAYGAATTYKWYWTTDFGSYIDATLDGQTTQAQNVRTLNAASFAQSVAPDAIAATFGSQLTSSTVNASSLPLPTSIGGITVTVNNITASLIYVSPSQINYVIPANVGPGAAAVRVMNNGNLVATGSATVETVSPSIFTVGANGQGVPAAQTTTNGTTFLPVANPDGSARQISVGTAAAPNYLVLYGTGLRRRSSLSNVRVTIGGMPVFVSYLGAHQRFSGLDQLNVKLPLELRGRGLVDVVVAIDGRPANTVRINIGY